MRLLRLIRLVLADAAAAAAITIIVALILASLSAAGVITMTLAAVLLVLAWLAGLGLTFLIKPIWNMTTVHKIIFSAMLGVCLAGVWLYESKSQAQNIPPAMNGNCNILGNGNNNNNLNCNTLPPRRSGALYQSDQIVGVAGGAQLDAGSNTVILQNLRISSSVVDLSAPMEMQNLLIKCRGLPQPRGMAAQISIAIAGQITCDIVGHR